MKGMKLLMAGLLFAPMAAQAEFSYSYLEGGWVRLDPDGGGSVDGFGINGSVEISDQAHLVAGFSHGEEGSLDVESGFLGIGLNHSLSDNLDVAGTVNYIHSSASFGFADASEDGFGAEGYLRGRLAPRFELDGGIRYTDVADSEVSVFARGIVEFTDTFGLSIEADAGDDASSYFVGLRATF